MKLTKKEIDNIVNIVKEKIDKDYPDQSGEYWYKTTVNFWEKGVHERIYINMKYGRYYKGRNKWQRGASIYIDCNEDKFEYNYNQFCNANEKRCLENAARAGLEILKKYRDSK